MVNRVQNEKRLNCLVKRAEQHKPSNTEIRDTKVANHDKRGRQLPGRVHFVREQAEPNLRIDNSAVVERRICKEINQGFRESFSQVHSLGAGKISILAKANGIEQQRNRWQGNSQDQQVLNCLISVPPNS
jgi:hypothetical protein